MEVTVFKSTTSEKIVVVEKADDDFVDFVEDGEVFIKVGDCDLPLMIAEKEIYTLSEAI